jgi:hypothetical protein
MDGRGKQSKHNCWLETPWKQTITVIALIVYTFKFSFLLTVVTYLLVLSSASNDLLYKIQPGVAP